MVTILKHHFLESIVLSLLDDEDEELRSFAASFLSSLVPSKKGHEIIRDGGGLEKMIELACSGSIDNSKRNALQGLLFASKDSLSQEHIARYLYRLLFLSWNICDPDSQLLLTQIMNNLALNPRNRSRLYKAELRCKAMLGWAHCKERREESSSAMESPQRSPARSRAESLEETMRKLKFQDSVKQDYVEWLDHLDAEDIKKPKKPMKKKKSRAKRATPRSKFVVSNPQCSPLWPVKEQILCTTAKGANADASLFSKNGQVENVPTGSHLHDVVKNKKDIAEGRHSPRAPFSTKEYRAANLDLLHRLKQPARTLYEVKSVDNRWSPRVDEVVMNEKSETIVRMVDEKGKRFVFNKTTFDIENESSTGSLTIWKHIPGARLYDGLPSFKIGNEEFYMYHTGQSRSTFDSIDGGGDRLMQVHGIRNESEVYEQGLPDTDDSLPLTPQFSFAQNWIKKILGPRPQGMCPRPHCPIVLSNTKREIVSTGNQELKDAGLIVDHLTTESNDSSPVFDAAGFMLDEPLPLIIRSVAEGKKER